MASKCPLSRVLPAFRNSSSSHVVDFRSFTLHSTLVHDVRWYKNQTLQDVAPLESRILPIGGLVVLDLQIDNRGRSFSQRIQNAFVHHVVRLATPDGQALDFMLNRGLNLGKGNFPKVINQTLVGRCN